jgi:hypothetical protein
MQRTFDSSVGLLIVRHVTVVCEQFIWRINVYKNIITADNKIILYTIYIKFCLNYDEKIKLILEDSMSDVC